jgi:tetratricopeptide (TPR) repeat protein
VQGPDGPYYLHPLTRRLALDNIESQSGEAQAALEQEFVAYFLRYARKYGGEDGDDVLNRYNRLEEQWSNVEAAVVILHGRTLSMDSTQQREASQSLLDLNSCLRGFLWFRGYWSERLWLGKCAFEAALSLRDHGKAAWRAYEVARVHAARNETQEAAVWIDRTKELVHPFFHKSPYTTRLFGLLAEEMGDLHTAEQHLREALAACPASSYEIKAALLIDLGNVARKQTLYAAAVSHYLEALTIHESRGIRFHQPIVYGKLGSLALSLGQLANARNWFEKELALGRQVGREISIASAHAGLARVLKEEGRIDEALVLAQQALAIQERLRHRDIPQTRELVMNLKQNNAIPKND